MTAIEQLANAATSRTIATTNTNTNAINFPYISIKHNNRNSSVSKDFIKTKFLHDITQFFNCLGENGLFKIDKINLYSFELATQVNSIKKNHS